MIINFHIIVCEPDRFCESLCELVADRVGVMLDHLESDLLSLVIQYIREKGFRETAQTYVRQPMEIYSRSSLQASSQHHFDSKYFQDLFLDANWDQVMAYLVYFIGKSNMHHHSIVVFEILKHKFLYYLEQGNKELAKWILKEEIKVLFNLGECDADNASSNLVALFNELTAMLTLDDFRKHVNLNWHENSRTTRSRVLPNILNYLMEKVPLVKATCRSPLQPPSGRLGVLVNQSANQMDRENKLPRLQTLFVDHDFAQEELVNYGNLSHQRNFPSEGMEKSELLPLLANYNYDYAEESEKKREEIKKRSRPGSNEPIVKKKQIKKDLKDSPVPKIKVIPPKKSDSQVIPTDVTIEGMIIQEDTQSIKFES